MCITDTRAVGTALHWHCRLCPILIYIIPNKSHLLGDMEWLLVQTLLSGNCPTRLSIRITSVFTIDLITRISSHITCIILPLLCSLFVHRL